MKKTYEKPAIEVSTIALEDIIAVSNMAEGKGVFTVFEDLFS